MKPIHKLNNGRGATLCRTCSVIISTGLTEDLYCEKCKPKQETFEEPKQETLEEAAERYQKHFGIRPNLFAQDDFIQGAKWQQERSYSEEEVLDLLLNCPYEFQDNIKSWFEQFKKK